jgi:hypothetical protein
MSSTSDCVGILEALSPQNTSARLCGEKDSNPRKDRFHPYGNAEVAIRKSQEIGGNWKDRVIDDY